MIRIENKPAWLSGVRIWAQYNSVGERIDLWEYVGTHNGLYFFKPYRKPVSALTFRTLSDLNTPWFKPFLLNLDKAKEVADADLLLRMSGV